MCLFPRIRFTTTTITAITSKMWMREPPTWVSRPRSHKTARIMAIVHSIVCHFSFVDAVRIRLLRAGYFGGCSFVYYTTKSDSSDSNVLTSIHTDSWYPGQMHQLSHPSSPLVLLPVHLCSKTPN